MSTMRTSIDMEKDRNLKNYFLQRNLRINKYGGRNMYQYKFTEDEEKRIKSNLDEPKTSTQTSIIDGFDEIDKKYKVDTSVTPTDNELNLKKLDDIVIDNEKIKDIATKELESERQATIDSIESKASSKHKDLENTIQSKKDDATIQKETIENLYQAKKENISDEALRRGLARSSIVINEIEAFDQDKINELIKVDKELSASISALNGEIDALKTEKESALSNYDISYAATLNKKINDLTSELASKQEEVVKYNNSIMEKEAEYRAKVDKQNASTTSKNISDQLDLAKFVNQYGEESLNAIKYEEKYNVALDYFNNLSRLDAMNELKGNAEYYKNQLGNRYYNLVAVMNNRRN